MKTPYLAVPALTILLSLSGCASHRAADSNGHSSRMSLASLSPPAQETVKKLTAGGRIEKIDKEKEHGKLVYDVEATVQGRHLEFLIADSDGEVLGTEVPIEISELPPPVRAAVEKYFGSTSGLAAMKGVEFGKTTYEVEGRKNGKRVELTLDPNGKKTD